MASENGWEPSRLSPDSNQLVWIKVPGSNNVSLQLQRGRAEKIMRAYAADYNAYIEPLRDPDSASYTPTNSVATSNHLNATAMDLNWNSHPFRINYAGFDQPKIDRMRDLLAFYNFEGVQIMFWAQDWDEPKDAMHHQLGYGTYERPDVLDRFIAQRIRPDGFSTYQRGTIQGPTIPTLPQQPTLSQADRYAIDIIREGQRRRITPRGIIIALSVALVESNMKMYANSGVPESLNLPHDAIGQDHDSVGLFQQRCPMWGPAEVLMNPTLSAGLFYDRLDNLDYNDEDNSPGWYAAEVQRPAAQYRGRYDERMNDARNLYERLVGITPQPQVGEDFLMGLNHEEQVEIRDKIRNLWDALWNTREPSLSRYGDPAIGWTAINQIRNDDAFLFDLITEHDASLGDPAALARIQKAALAGDVIAQNFLDKLNSAPNPTAVEDSDLKCWNCGKSYPEVLEKCPFCGVGPSAPVMVPPVLTPVATPPQPPRREDPVTPIHSGTGVQSNLQSLDSEISAFRDALGGLTKWLKG